MKNSKKNEKLKIRANTGDIIVLGGTIIAAAIGAAFLAHRGRSRNDNEGKESRKNDEEKGLQSLLHLGKEESSTDSLMENKGEERLSIELHGEDEGERGENCSEGLGDSSTESSNEAVWPAELIDQDKEIQGGLNEMNIQQGEGDESLGMGIQSILPRKLNNGRGVEEFASDNSVEIPETKYMVTAENPLDVNTIAGNVVVNDFSFWSNKQNAPPGKTEQYIEESDVAHVIKNELLDEEEVEKEEISKTNEIKQQLEISKTTRDIFASECENNMGVLENLLPSSISIEQQNGQVSIDKSARTKDEEEDLNSKSQEVTEFHGEDVGERRGEESEGSINSLEVSSDQSVCQEDLIEQEKIDNSMLTNEVNDQFDIPRKVEHTDESAKGFANNKNIPIGESLSNGVEFNMLDDETSEILEELKISHVEVDLVVDEEKEEGGDQSSHIDGVGNVEEKGGDGIAHLNVEAKGGNIITNVEVEEVEVEEVEEDENGGDGVVIRVENEVRGDNIANIEIKEEQNGGDDITNIEEEQDEEEEVEVGGDQSSHIDRMENGEEKGGDQSSHIDRMENEEEKGGDGIAHLNVEAGGNNINNIEVEEVEDENGGDGVAIKVENGARGDSIVNIELEEEQQQNGGDDITNIEEEEEVEGEDQSLHINGEENEEEKGDGIVHLNVEAEGGNDITNIEVEVEEDENGGDGVVMKVENEARGDNFANIEIEEEEQNGGDDITNIEEEEGGDQSSHVDGVENEEENGGDGIVHLNVEAKGGNGIINVEVEEDANGGDGVVIKVENEVRGDHIANTKIKEEQQQNGGDGITIIEEVEEVGGDQSSHIVGVENEEEKGGDGQNGGDDITNIEEEEVGGDQSLHIDSLENEEENGGDGQNGGDGITSIEEEEEEVGGDLSSHIDGMENEEEKGDGQNGGDGITNIEEEVRGDQSSHIDAVENEEENGGDGQNGGDGITNIEEEVGGDRSSHIDGVENKEENGGDGIAHPNVEAKGGNHFTNIEVEEVEEDENGGNDVVIKVENGARGENIANIKIEEEQQQNGGADITNIEVVVEKYENGGEGVAIDVDNEARVDDITHIEVEEPPQNGGCDITHTKVVLEDEVREDDIAHTEVEAVKELKEGEEEKKENEGEGIAHIEDKGAEVDEAKEEKGGDANTEVLVVEEEHKGDNIAYSKLEEEIEEEEKGDCIAHIELEEEIGDDRRHKEIEVAVEEEVKEEEKEGDDTTYIEVQKEEQEERGDDNQERSSLESRKEEIKSHVEEENEMQESIAENTSMEFDGKEVWTAEEGELEKHSEPMYETNKNLESPEVINQMVGIPPAEVEENTSGGIQSFLPCNDKNREVAVGISVAVQETDHINLKLETDSQNTCKSFEVAMETDEGKAVANIDHGNVTIECPYSVEISNFSQNENEQDLQEPDACRIVEEEDKSSIEAEIESYIERDAESTKDESEETRISSKVSEEEKRLPFIENEMKLKSESPKMTAGLINHITNKESEITVIGKEKKMDFILAGHSKGMFFLVLALALALGLLVLAHHHEFHNNHNLPKIYRQVYQFLFPSSEGPLDEF